MKYYNDMRGIEMSDRLALVRVECGGNVILVCDSRCIWNDQLRYKVVINGGARYVETDCK